MGCARKLTGDLRPLSLLLALAAFVLVEGCGSLPMNTNEPSFQRRYGDFTYCPVEVVRQSRNTTCGPACLSSVLAYWDVEIPERQILQKYPTRRRRPYLLLELRAIAEAEGLKAYVIAMDAEPRREVEEHISKGRPLICAIRPPTDLYLFDGVPVLGPACDALAWALSPRKDHFVVIAGCTPGQVLIMDPAHGFAAVPWPRFEPAWSKMKHACLLVAN
ncbi:MAG: hypothetical protein A2Y77_16150 [Planctomycetes bacterium RBG_13_62_9]|nr:MAG: hypothetical protein A2Y77_16150 [Planctomycetes bacterium RBG_13_62_9]